MGTYNTELRLIGGKVEGTSGTAEVTLEYDTRVASAELGTVEVTRSGSDMILDGTHTKVTTAPTGAKVTFDYVIEAKNGEFIATGTPGTPTWENKLPFSKYLYSAGLQETVTQPTDETTQDGSWKFAPSKYADCQTVTMAITDEDPCGGPNLVKEYKLKGGMSTLTVTASTDAPFTFNLGTTGAPTGVEDVTAIVFADADTLGTPLIQYLNTDIIITEVNHDGSDKGATPLSIESSELTLDTGIGLMDINSQAEQYGLKLERVATRAPQLTVNPYLQSQASYDYWDALTSETVYKIDIINYTDNTKTVEQCKIEIGRAQLVDAPISDDGGALRQSQVFTPLKNLQGVTDIDKENDYIITINGITIDQTV